jgi:hypothetical protein
VGIWLTIEVGAFSLMILCTYIAFLDQSAIDAVLSRLRRLVARTPRRLAHASAAE